MRAPPLQRTPTECGVVAMPSPLDNCRAAIIGLLAQRSDCDEVTRASAHVPDRTGSRETVARAANLFEMRNVRPNYDGLGRKVDWRYLARDAPFDEMSAFLWTFNSCNRTEAMALMMILSSAERSLRIFLNWGNMCDAPWAFRSTLADQLRSAIARVELCDFLEPEERAFYSELPSLIAIWRGCERGRERGLSWTTNRTVAEGFAQGKRCINANPTLVSAAIPKQHIFGVFLDRDEWEVTVDPRRLRRFQSRAVAPAAW